MKVIALNAQPIWEGDARSGKELSQLMQKKLLRLKGTFLHEDGTGVDYAQLVSSADFQEYKDLARELQKVDPDSIGDENDRRCFFLNLYNSLTVHGICNQDWQGPNPPTSVIKIPDFWNTTAYQIGNITLTLNEMEHGILRGNRPHPSPGSKVFFADSDPRKSLVVPLDCRIHFALVCGAKSCPPIRVFQSTNLERGLALAAKSFCDSEITVEGDTVVLSKLFDWYSKDFGETQTEVLTTLSGFMSEGDASARDELKKVIESRGHSWGVHNVRHVWRVFARGILKTQNMLPGPLKFRFKAYDWTINNKPMNAK